MAGIDKIYGTTQQRRELKRFIRRLRIPGYRKRALYRSFYPIVGNGAMLTNFTCEQDRFLWRQEGLPAWARDRLREQYNGSPIKRPAEQHSDNHGVQAHCGAWSNAEAQQVGAPSPDDSTGEPTK